MTDEFGKFMADSQKRAKQFFAQADQSPEPAFPDGTARSTDEVAKDIIARHTKDGKLDPQFAKQIKSFNASIGIAIKKLRNIYDREGLSQQLNDDNWLRELNEEVKRLLGRL